MNKIIEKAPIPCESTHTHTHDTLKENKRIIYFDILNIIAIVSVVAMHCNGIVHRNPSARAWNTSLIIDCICYFAVPLFCMLSGATLMEYRKKYDTKTFFKKRLLKVAVPFVFWAIVMFIWKIHTKQLDISGFCEVKDWINAFFTNKEEGTYYFMFEILGVYLTMPIVSLLAKDEYRKTLWFTILLAFIFNGFIPNILSLFGIYYNSNMSIKLGGYVIYVLMGYLLSTETLKKKYRILIYIGAIIGLIYRYATTFILSKEAGYVVKTTWGYFSWHCMLLSSAVFIFIKNINFDKLLDNSNKVTKIISNVSACSFGIYLIHQIAMYYQQNIFDINVSSWEWRTVGILTTYFISLVIIYILKKIPLARRIVP